MTYDLLGYDEDGLPIWAMFGAEGDDGDDGGDDTADDDDAGDDGDGDDDDDTGEPDRKQPKSAKATDKKQATKKAVAYRPPSEAEWRRTQEALKKANAAQAAQRKAALEKARKEGMDEAAAKAREEAMAEADTTWKPRVINTEARASLVEMGCKNPARLIKLIDHTKVSVEGDGLLGLEEQLNELKDEWPELFRSADEEKPRTKKEAPPAKKVGAAAGASKKDEGDGKKATGAQLVAQRLLGVSS